MAKIDYKKELKELYAPGKKEVVTVTVPEMKFLMIDGQGDPNTAKEYKEAVEALFAVSYTAKFSIKKSRGFDYGVLPLEGLWWMDDMNEFSIDRKSEWKWTMMIMQPDVVEKEDVDLAMDSVRRKKNPPALPNLRFESFTEGLAAQIMYVGAYVDEAPTIKRIHEYIAEQGNRLSGKHHEIYLGDPRRTAPERLKTVIRQPMSK